MVSTGATYNVKYYQRDPSFEIDITVFLQNKYIITCNEGKTCCSIRKFELIISVSSPQSLAHSVRYVQKFWRLTNT